MEIIKLKVNEEDFEFRKPREGPSKLASRIVEALKEKGLYSKDLLYRGLSASRLKEVMENGSDNSNRIIYAAPEKSGEHAFSLEVALNLACIGSKRGLFQNKNAISVYKPKSLEQLSDISATYHVPEGSYPIAIIRMKYPRKRIKQKFA